MASNKRFLRAFVEYDGTGRVLPGSLVLRGNIPRVGNWGEIPAYQCCNPSTPMSNTIIAGGEPGTICVYGFEFLCDELFIFGVGFDFGNTMTSVLAGLNSSYGFLGEWTAPDSGTIKLAMKDDVAKGLCPNGTITINFICGG